MREQRVTHVLVEEWRTVDEVEYNTIRADIGGQRLFSAASIFGSEEAKNEGTRLTPSSCLAALSSE
jgi:hypothetical protein